MTASRGGEKEDLDKSAVWQCFTKSPSAYVSFLFCLMPVVLGCMCLTLEVALPIKAALAGCFIGYIFS